MFFWGYWNSPHEWVPQGKMKKMAAKDDKTMDISEVKEKVRKGLEYARWKILDRQPFIGEMLLRFSIVPTYDQAIETAATDGTKIFFDCEFYSKLDEAEREFVLAHEVWHNIFLHFTRRSTRDTMLWNVATDMEINHMLQNEGMKVLSGACLPDPIVAGKNAEDIYAYLMKQMQKNSQKQNNGDGQGGGQGGSGGKNGGSSSSSSGENDQGDGSGDENNCGNNNTKFGNQFDKHVYEGQQKKNSQGNGQGDKQKNGKWGPRGNDPDFNPSMKDGKEVENQIKEMVCSVAQSIERKQGHLPAGIDQIVKEMLKPEIDWKEALSQFVTKVFGSGEHNWRRCSRHALARDFYLPGRSEERIKIAVCLDTSGSYLADLPKFLGELNSLLNTFGRYEITLIQCDAEVQDVETFDQDSPIDVKHFKTKGGGGTDFRPAFKWIREHDEDSYSCILFFTDGYGSCNKYPPSKPVLWILTSDGTDEFCDWGEKIRFKHDRAGDRF